MSLKNISAVPYAVLLLPSTNGWEEIIWNRIKAAFATRESLDLL